MLPCLEEPPPSSEGPGLPLLGEDDVLDPGLVGGDLGVDPGHVPPPAADAEAHDAHLAWHGMAAPVIFKMIFYYFVAKNQRNQYHICKIGWVTRSKAFVPDTIVRSSRIREVRRRRPARQMFVQNTQNTYLSKSYEGAFIELLKLYLSLWTT